MFVRSVTPKPRFSKSIGVSVQKCRKNRAPHNHPLILSARRNETRIARAYATMLDTVKSQIRVGELATAILHQDWTAALKILNIQERLKQVALGHGLKPGILSLRDALR